jgi:hypothetical protein
MSLEDKNSITNKQNAKIFKSHSSIAYNSSSVACGTVSIGKQSTPFVGFIVPVHTESRSPRRVLLDSEDAGTMILQNFG